MIKKPLTILTTLAAMSVCAHAQIVFENPEQDFHASRGETEQSFEYAFTNEGDYPVTITRVKAACGCTTPSLDKKTYEPGESGVIKATFKFGSRKGKQSKTIHVSTDDPKNAAYTLRFTGQIEETLSISPRHLIWSKEDGQIEKSITVKSLIDEPVELTDAKLSLLGGKTRIETIEKGKQYKVHVIPPEVARAQPVSMTLFTDLKNKDGTQSKFTSFLRIPSSVAVDPVFISWPANEQPLKPRTIKVEKSGNAPMRLVSVEARRSQGMGGDEDAEFKTSVKKVEDGKLYEVTVTPPENPPLAAQLAIEVEVENSRHDIIVNMRFLGSQPVRRRAVERTPPPTTPPPPPPDMPPPPPPPPGLKPPTEGPPTNVEREGKRTMIIPVIPAPQETAEEESDKQE